MLTSVLFASILMAAKLHGDISVPGYTPIVLAIMFFGGLASLGLSDNIYGFGRCTWSRRRRNLRRPRAAPKRGWIDISLGAATSGLELNHAEGRGPG
jgi:hypothetical protein